MALSDDLEQIAEAAAAFAAPGERVTGILAAEPLRSGRVFLCAYATGDERPAWLALDADGAPVASLSRRARSREARRALRGRGGERGWRRPAAAARSGCASSARPRRRRGSRRRRLAAAELAETLEAEPRLATTDYLDRIGAAARRLEQALGDDAGSPFAAAMQQALPAVDEVAAEVERALQGTASLGSWKAAVAVASDSRSGATPRI